MFTYLARPIRRFPSTCRARVGGMASTTIFGASGHQYIRGEVLHKNEDGEPTIFKAAHGDVPVVVKEESKSIFDLSRRLSDEFKGFHRLRLPVDFCPRDRVVVYPYFTSTLLDIIRTDPAFPPVELKKVLRSVGEALQEFHSKSWLHLDVKPDNIFVNWTGVKGNNQTVIDATLGDFGISFKQVGAVPLRSGVALGNVMWRSPEGHTGSGITKASDIFSYGLVCIYALGGRDLLLLEDKAVLAELARLGISPEEDILTRHFSYFGPVNEGLLTQVDSCGHSILKRASATAEVAVKNQPELRFEVWGNDLGEAALNMIAGMTRPDPTARLTIDQILDCSWWQEP